MALSHSSRTRSALTLRNVASDGSMARSVAGSSSNSSVAHEARGAEHAEAVLGEALASASPTARSTFARQICRPSNGSIEVAVRGSTAMALIVKSRRARSAVMSSTKCTASGRRPSVYVALAAQRGDLVVRRVRTHGDGAVLDAGRDHAGTRDDVVGPRVGGDVPVTG